MRTFMQNTCCFHHIFYSYSLLHRQISSSPVIFPVNLWITCLFLLILCVRHVTYLDYLLSGDFARILLQFLLNLHLHNLIWWVHWTVILMAYRLPPSSARKCTFTTKINMKRCWFFQVAVRTYFPLNVNVFPSADILSPLFYKFSSPAFTIIKPNGVGTEELLEGVPISHWLAIYPFIALISQPNYILHQLFAGALLILIHSL
jgi:hypothetical protein